MTALFITALFVACILVIIIFRYEKFTTIQKEVFKDVFNTYGNCTEKDGYIKEFTLNDKLVWDFSKKMRKETFLSDREIFELNRYKYDNK